MQIVVLSRQDPRSVIGEGNKEKKVQFVHEIRATVRLSLLSDYVRPVAKKNTPNMLEEKGIN